MDTQQITAPPCAQPAASGVIHSNVRHTAGFTVIGNHLAQHRGLSLVALGLAVHIQSLPAGAKIGIKRLAERFPESEARIAAALRELEAAGYLHRSRVRLADGRIVTRTVSYNQPGADAPTAAAPRPRLTRGTAEPAPREPSPVISAQSQLLAPAAPAPQPAAVLVPPPDRPHGNTRTAPAATGAHPGAPAHGCRTPLRPAAPRTPTRVVRGGHQHSRAGCRHLART